MEGPDSGYSWVVVVCCAYVHFALFGIFRSAGVMFVAMLQNYDVTREEASWPFALASGIFQITGPLTSLITHYVSQRKACLLGAFISTFGVAGCYFAESITWINIFYGVIHGFGFGILATLMTVTLNQYFVKYRATAIGIAFSGGSISSLVFPMVMEWLLENYSLKDSFLLLSGVVMNTLVAASLLRAPPWMLKPKVKQKLLENGDEAQDSGVSTSTEHNVDTKRTLDLYQKAPQAEPENSEVEDHDDVHTASRDSPTIDTKHSDNSSADSKRDFPDTNDTVCSNNDSVLFGGSYTKLNTIVESSKNGNVKRDELEVREPLICDNKTIVIVPKKEVAEIHEKPELNSGLRYSLTSILKQSIFYKIAFTMCIYFLGVHSFFMVIVDFAKDKGIPEDKGIYIISMFSLTDLIGRAGLGWVTDHNYISRRDMVCLNLTILGILYLLYPLVDVLPGILTIAAIQGLAVGCSITLFFVIQVESMGLKNLTLVVGLTSFINGISSLLRPGIIGLFRDVIGSYNWMFHCMGGATLIVAFIWFLESYRMRGKTPPTVCDEKV